MSTKLVFRLWQLPSEEHCHVISDVLTHKCHRSASENWTKTEIVFCKLKNTEISSLHLPCLMRVMALENLHDQNWIQGRKSSNNRLYFADNLWLQTSPGTEIHLHCLYQSSSSSKSHAHQSQMQLQININLCVVKFFGKQCHIISCNQMQMMEMSDHEWCISRKRWMHCLTVVNELLWLETSLAPNLREKKEIVLYSFITKGTFEATAVTLWLWCGIIRDELVDS